MDNNTHMIIDKLNTLMGTSTSHIIQNTTNALYATATFTDGLILLTDNPYKLYKKTGGSKTAVAEPTNTDVINATVNMMQPDGYIGVTVDDIIDSTWPPKIPNSRTYVCDSFTTLFGLTGIKKGEIAIIGDYTYLLITFNYRNTADWIQLNNPISTATQTALGLKSDKSTTYTKTEVDSLLAAKQTQITALQAAVTALQ